MVRGSVAKVGDTLVNANGYHNTRTEEGWRLTHHILAEEKLGRPLHPNERVSFKDKDRKNLSPDNLVIREVGEGSVRRRAAQIRARIQELQAELDELEQKV